MSRAARHAEQARRVPGRGMSTEIRAAEDPASQAAVDVSDRAAIARWTRALGVTDEALLRAVQKVGDRVDRIKDYLTGGMAGEQSGG